MAYSEKLRQAILALPKSRERKLGKQALRLSMPVTWISGHTGASRTTVYNWLYGTTLISPAYRAQVDDLIASMAATNSVDDLRPVKHSSDS